MENGPKIKIPLERKKRQFWKWHDQGNNLGGCRILGFDKGANKNRLSVLGTYIQIHNFSGPKKSGSGPG